MMWFIRLGIAWNRVQVRRHTEKLAEHEYILRTYQSELRQLIREKQDRLANMLEANRASQDHP